MIDQSRTDSGNGLNVDKGQGTFGWFKITSSSGYFQYRRLKNLGVLKLGHLSVVGC